MNPQPQPGSLNPRYEECLRLHKCWPWFLVLGIGLMVVGALAIGVPFLTGLLTVAVLGWLLVAAGVVQIVNAFLARSWQGFFAHMLAGILQLIVGGLMIDRPLRALAALTFMLAAAFLVGGIFRVVVALKDNFAGSVWILLSGVITFALGILIWRGWPESSELVIGLFIGIDLIFTGWSWVMLAIIVKASAPGAPQVEPGAHKSLPAGVN